VLEEGERIGECLVVQAGSFAHLVGRVEATAGMPGTKPALRASLAPI
jgi:hypothetical protein